MYRPTAPTCYYMSMQPDKDEGLDNESPMTKVTPNPRVGLDSGAGNKDSLSLYALFTASHTLSMGSDRRSFLALTT